MTNPNLAIKYATMSVAELMAMAKKDAEKAGITVERALYIKLQMSLNEEMPKAHNEYRRKMIDALKSLMALQLSDMFFAEPTE
jgi:hypothetical protein